MKRILVPIDPTEHAQAATVTACRVAKQHDASVSGIAVLDSSEIRSSLIPAVGPYYPGVMEEVVNMRDHADGILKECLEKFATTCEEMGVPHLETEYEGIPVQKLLESAIFHDLIVVGLRTSFHFETRRESVDNLDSLLDRTVTPILAVPAQGLEKPTSAIVAFDGSLGSARALQDFSRFARPYEGLAIKVVVAGKEKHEAEFLSGNAKSFLEAHGYTGVETGITSSKINDVIDQEIKDGANLVVAGIHSKQRIKDIFVGSFTKSLIKRGDVATFLSH